MSCVSSWTSSFDCIWRSWGGHGRVDIAKYQKGPKLEQSKDIARETIASASAERLRQKGVGLSSLASSNAATSEGIARDMQSMNEPRVSGYTHLRRGPTISRIVLTDDDGATRTRAATCLGLTCAGTALPTSIAALEAQPGQDWKVLKA